MAHPELPTTMKAWQYSATKGGLPKNLAINSNASVPKAGPKQILVKVAAVALNPVDYKPAENALIHRLVIPKPATPGIDFVGTIVTAPADSKLKIGQLVFGVAKNPFAGGMLAEYAVTDKDTAIPVAESVDPIDAASIGVAALTAYQTITKAANPGSRIFINGGSGGTGIFGIQIAKALGHDVTVTCSARNIGLCQSLGAEVIDYTKAPVLDILKGGVESRRYDLVVDNVFSDSKLYWKAHEYTKPGAIYVVVAGSPTWKYMSEMTKMRLTPGFLGGGKRRIEGFLTKTEAGQLTQIQQWILEKKVRAVIDSRFPFEDAPQAFEKLKTGRAVGKIIIEVDPSVK